jgi:methylphosphotriester-DNA--protein-cysteine methyltransferase
MGDHAKSHCKKGHELVEPNVICNSEGFRQCRRCKYDRNNALRRIRRAKKRKETA